MPTAAERFFRIVLMAFGSLAWAQSPTVRIAFTGQSMIRSDIRLTAPSAVSAISSLIEGADVRFTNFEGTVAEPGQPNRDVPMQGRGFLAPPEALDALEAAGFNLVVLSNNHSYDLRVPGIRNTLRAVNRLNLAHAGIGETIQDAVAPGYLHTPHATVALIGMASGLVPAGGAATATRPGVDELRVDSGSQPNPEDAETILNSIREAAKKADLVIVYQHNHVFEKSFTAIFEEGMPERLRPPDWLKKWAHSEIDAGADVIVMHGAPLLHGIEIYKGHPIFYDLGNFIYNVPPALWYIQEPMAWESAVAIAEFEGRRLRSITLRPIVLNVIGQGQPDAQDLHANNRFLQTRGLPQLATGDKAEYILERIAEYSRLFGTLMDVKAGVAEIRLGN
ncbi:MAG TPA: CapA family protein [Bryobacteraceae bacterium]|nr:CapA family protein [Bryobacteraceae bacterium]